MCLLFPARPRLIRDQNVSRFSLTLHLPDFGRVVVFGCQITSFDSGSGLSLAPRCLLYREALLTPCFCVKVSRQTDSGAELTANGHLCYSSRLKTFLLSLKTAGSFVSLHYTTYPAALIWEEVLLTFLLIVSIFKATILSSPKAINREVRAGTLRI